MFWWWGDPWGAGHWIGFGFMSVFWIAVIVGLVFLIRHAVARSAESTRPPSVAEQSPAASESTRGEAVQGAAEGERSSEALRILEERYARGEIDREEFLQMKDDLGG